VAGDNALAVEPLVAFRQSVTYADDTHDLDEHGSFRSGYGIRDDIVDDVIVTGGNDTLNGNDGNDLLTGDNTAFVDARVQFQVTQVHAPGLDWGDHGHIQGVGQNVLDDIVGNIQVTDGADTMNGGAGDDQLAGDSRAVIQPFISVNLRTDAHGSVDPHVEEHSIISDLVLTAGNDTLTDDAGNNVLIGDSTVAVMPTTRITVTDVHSTDLRNLKDYDLLFGPVAEHIFAKDGNDTLTGGAGKDFIVGDDSLSMQFADTAKTTRSSF